MTRLACLLVTLILWSSAALAGYGSGRSAGPQDPGSARGTAHHYGTQHPAQPGLPLLDQVVAGTYPGLPSGEQTPMAAGAWRMIPSSNPPLLTQAEHNAIVAANPGSLAFWGASGSNAVINAYCGAAYDDSGHRWFFSCGGHSDYGGNEIYQFDFDTLAWTRLKDPAPYSGPPQYYSTKSPAYGPWPMHTLDGLVYIPNGDKIWYFGGFPYDGNGSGDGAGAYNHPSFNSTVGLWRFNLGTNLWENSLPTDTVNMPAYNAVNPRTNGVIGISTASPFKIVEINPSTAQYSYIGSDIGDGWDAFQANLIDAKGSVYMTRRSAYGLCGYPAISEINLSGGSLTITPVASCWPSDMDAVRAQSGGFAYHPQTDRFVLWPDVTSGSGTGDVWTYQFSDGNFYKISETPGKVPPVRQNAISSKFVYVYSDIFAGIPKSGTGVWLYKLPAP